MPEHLLYYGGYYCITSILNLRDENRILRWEDITTIYIKELENRKRNIFKLQMLVKRHLRYVLQKETSIVRQADNEHEKS